MSAIKADDRPFDFTPIETADLPATPTRERNIAASTWVEAPAELLTLGEPLGIAAEATAFKRRIGDWLLWRAGPARGTSKSLAIDSRDLTHMVTFTLEADGTHHGIGPTGIAHDRFRTFKEDLLGRR